MRKSLKIVVIVIALFLLVFINLLLGAGKEGGSPNFILTLLFLAFAGGIWKWKPKDEDNNQIKKKE